MRDEEAEVAFNKLQTDLAAGEVSIFDLLSHIKGEDYKAYIDFTRFFFVVMNEPEVLKQFMKDISERAGNASRTDSIQKGFERKDGGRRFEKLISTKEQVRAEASPLLSGGFEERLSTYLRLISHVEKRWGEAAALHRNGDFALATFVAISVIEEIGKLSNLNLELMDYDSATPIVSEPIIDRDHRRKHFLALASGALINARLDRVLGKDVVRRVLHEAESDILEKVRQSCLYIDFQAGVVRTPNERIDSAGALIYVVLAGELMAEVLGSFPWEFERMIEAVVAFEREAGLPEKKITRR